MVSISEAAREIIRKKPLLEDFLSKGIINYNSLAIDIKDEIQTLVGHDRVKISSVAMALRRIGEHYRETVDNEISRKLRDFVNTNTTIHYDLFEITIAISEGKNISRLISRIYGTIDTRKGDFLSITKGRSEITIITNMKLRDKIHELIGGHDIKDEILDLATLSISLPEDSLKTTGLFYYFTKALTLEGINIIELVSTYTEMQFILDEEDIHNATELIRNLIKTTSAFE